LAYRHLPERVKSIGIIFVPRFVHIAHNIGMSYVTVEVDIHHGRLIPKEPEKLPQNGRGLLTVLPSEVQATAADPVQVLEQLQRYLRIDQQQAENWTATVREGRR